MNFKLIIDTREKALFPYLYNLTIPYEKQQITVGDYAMMYNDKIVASFERKTYEDFASSLKDGRYKNKEKMIELRKKTNCKLFFIIEGIAFPNKKRCFSNVPYAAIESAIDHLMYRDNIHIIYTSSEVHTVERLNSFAYSMRNLINKENIEENLIKENLINDADKVFEYNLTEDNLKDITVQLISCMEALRDYLKKMFEGMTGGDDIDTDITEKDEKTHNQLLHEKVVKTEKNIAAEIISQVQGITAQSAEEVLKKYSPYDILSKKYNPADLNKLHHTNGRKLSTRAINNLKNINGRTEIKMLTCITGISENSAKYLLKYSALVSLLNRSEADLENSYISREKKLGIRAKLVLKSFYYSDKK